jgi:hypothetical protein
VFTSVALTAAITTRAEHWNEEPKPFIWKATAEDIIDKVRRGRAILHRIKTQTEQRGEMTKRPGTSFSPQRVRSRIFRNFRQPSCADADQQALWKGAQHRPRRQDEFAALGLTGCCSTVLACAENGDQVGLISIRG